MNALEHALKVNRGLRAEFLRRGGTVEQWGRISADPREFNRVWRRVLGLPEDTAPPPAGYRGLVPGEMAPPRCCEADPGQGELAL